MKGTALAVVALATVSALGLLVYVAHQESAKSRPRQPQRRRRRQGQHPRQGEKGQPARTQALTAATLLPLLDVILVKLKDIRKRQQVVVARLFVDANARGGLTVGEEKEIDDMVHQQFTQLMNDVEAHCCEQHGVSAAELERALTGSSPLTRDPEVGRRTTELKEIVASINVKPFVAAREARGQS